MLGVGGGNFVVPALVWLGLDAKRAAGTTAVLESEPFERRFRDAMCISQHLQATPWHLEMVGRHLLGVPQVPQFV